MADLALQTFGTLELRSRTGRGEPIARNAVGLAVLGYLSQVPNHRADRRHLARLFWPHADVCRGRRLLRQALYYVTSGLSVAITRRTEEVVALAADRVRVDALEFRERVSRGEYREAISVYGGRFLQSFALDNRTELGHWLDARQERLESHLNRAYLQGGTDPGTRRHRVSLVEQGDHERGMLRAREYVRRNPLDHDTHARLIRVLLREGHESLAYRIYEAYRMELLERKHEVPEDVVELIARGSDGMRHPEPRISGADPRSYL